MSASLQIDSDSSPVLDADLDHIASMIRKRGLSVPAIFLLELHKPLTTLFHGAMLTSQPLLSLILGGAKSERAAKLFESRDNIEKLICLLENDTEETRSYERS